MDELAWQCCCSDCTTVSVHKMLVSSPSGVLSSPARLSDTASSRPVMGAPACCSVCQKEEPSVRSHVFLTFADHNIEQDQASDCRCHDISQQASAGLTWGGERSCRDDRHHSSQPGAAAAAVQLQC